VPEGPIVLIRPVVLASTWAMERLMRRIIASTEVVGGALGLVLLTVAAAKVPISGWGTGFYLFAGAFASTIAAGVLLFRGDRRGYPISVVVQAAQVLCIATGPVVARFQAGPQLLVGKQGGQQVAYAGFNADATLQVPAPLDEPRGIVVNLIPIVVICLLFWLRRSPGAASRAESHSAPRARPRSDNTLPSAPGARAP
jgi:hypothetical protein